MTDLRKSAEMALEGFEKIHEGCGFVKEEAKFKEDKNVRNLATEVRKDCNKYMEALRQALAQPEKETLTLDRGCWERGCVTYDERDGDGVTIEAKLKEKNGGS